MPQYTASEPVSSYALRYENTEYARAALLADLLEETRAHPAAEHLVDDGQRVAIGIVTAERTGAEHEVRLLERSLEDA